MARPRGTPKSPATGRAGGRAKKKKKAPAVIDAEAVEHEAAGGDDEDAEPDESDDHEAADHEPDDDALVAEVEGDAEDIDAGAVDAELARLTGEDERASEKKRASVVRRDPLTAYIQETRRYPLLSREEEHALAVKLIETDDPGAARRLIEANLRLVVKIAYEYRRAHKNLLDLIQEGNIGLMQAVRKYDPYRGVKLSSYAAWWIRAYILKFILNNWRLVKIGTTQAQRKLFFNLRKEKEKLEQLGYAAEPALLAERLDVRERDVIEMEKRMSAPDSSFDAPLTSGDGEGTRTRHDFVASDEAGRPDVKVEEREFHALLREKLEAFAGTLEGREETIFRERWLTDAPLTLQELGDRYGVSRERARQLEKRMLTRLRKYLEAELGTAVDIDSLARD
jgi:RNA polymerase sigma-32 factor